MSPPQHTYLPPLSRLTCPHPMSLLSLWVALEFLDEEAGQILRYVQAQAWGASNGSRKGKTNYKARRAA